MSKKYSVFLVLLFSLFLGGICLGSLYVGITAPEKDFSPLENRYLAKPPRLTAETLTNGEFMKGAEKFINDHVVGRDLWVAMKAWSERLSGKRENNGVYLGERGTLINRVDTPDPAEMEKQVDFVNQLVNQVDVPVYFGLIPSAAQVWSSRLPEGAPTADEGAVIERAYEQAQTHTVDMLGTLTEHQSEELYYRTDHHWTSLGAYYGYTALMDAMGLEALPLDESQKVTVSRSFYGTLFSSSGARWVEPDHIDRYISAEGVEVIAYPSSQPEPGSLYVDSYLSEKDQYSSFLGGNKPLCVIKTQHTDAPRLLVVRDSYSDSLAPFLTQNFSEIHLFDPRYNLNSVRAYVEENQIDAVAVLYSLSNFITADRLFVLAK